MSDMKIIARIFTPFATKFGVPRQSGIAQSVPGRIVFEPEYRTADAVRGLEEFSHIWLIWCFSETASDDWSPTVRPPRLGGNVRMGVFATRSPFRPNPIGLSSVELERIEISDTLGPVLHVRGADLVDGTPIYDIKPYIPYADSHPEARGGFTDKTPFEKLIVQLPQELASDAPEGLLQVLENDPRPRYHADAERIYGMHYAGKEVHFKVADGVLSVISIK